MKLSPSSNTPLWLTKWGAGCNDVSGSIALDGHGNIWAGGLTRSQSQRGLGNDSREGRLETEAERTVVCVEVAVGQAPGRDEPRAHEQEAVVVVADPAAEETPGRSDQEKDQTRERQTAGDAGLRQSSERACGDGGPEYSNRRRASVRAGAACGRQAAA